MYLMLLEKLFRMAFHMRNKICVILILICYSNISFGFNLSPKPNLIIKDPQLRTGIPKYESSYFGYTILLRKSGVFVGAPRAQSSLVSQYEINEPGAIYRCNIFENNGCHPYAFESRGNILSKHENLYLHNSEMRDFQWLGAAMDGGPSDDDKLIVCAPLLRTPTPAEYWVHGICYWVQNTKDPRIPMNIQRITLKYTKVKSEYYGMGEQGFSAHISANGEEIIVGAPGVFQWKGYVIRNHVTTNTVYVPNPLKFQQRLHSYFGYSVSSGYFDSTNRQRLMCLASAPQANDRSGEAYIFYSSVRNITKQYIFRGEQFGEYFGYAVLGEDINGDGLTDVIITANQYSVAGNFNEGAIYLFINEGGFNFKRKLIISPIIGESVRFGTTITALGDINHDGYNDIAVGAPFDENGSVFVFLGSEKGLRDQPSQHFRSPIGWPSAYGAHMFGHGLAKGNDIDANGYNDFAIGAPNAEFVFVYRAYPVVKIYATINSNIREITTDQKELTVRICYKIESKSELIKRHDIALSAMLDRQVKRVKFNSVNTNEMNLTVTAVTEIKCIPMKCSVKSNIRDIFRPIELELHYEIIRGVPDSEVFCDECAAVDPADPKQYSEKISFTTGCGSKICEADLKIESIGLNDSFILGSSSTISVTYEISNHGETAYLPQINVTSSNHLTFTKLPANCELQNDKAVMICDLFNGQPMPKGAIDTIDVTYDVSDMVGGTQLALDAAVSSAGRESYPNDNIVLDYITLIEYTEIEVMGTTKTPYINLKEAVSNKHKIINFYELKSHGPSQVDFMEVILNIPVAYKAADSSKEISIIDMNSIKIRAHLGGQLPEVLYYYQNGTQIEINHFETSNDVTNSETDIMRENINGDNNATAFAADENEMHFNNNADEVAEPEISEPSHRSRREIDNTSTNNNNNNNIKNNDLKYALPLNRTLFFNCNNTESAVCIRAVISIHHFKPEMPLNIHLKYNLQLEAVGQVLSKPLEYFAIFIGLDASKPSDPHGNNLALTKKFEYNIIWKEQKAEPSLWILILSIVGGVLLLIVITFGMYKAGFFKRAKKEEMDRLIHRASVHANQMPTESSHLNSDN